MKKECAFGSSLAKSIPSWTMLPSLSHSLSVIECGTPHPYDWEHSLKAHYAVYLFTCICGILLGLTSAQSNPIDHSVLNSLLARHVNAEGWVDYAGLREERPALESYLDTLRNVNAAKLPSDRARLAFWINAYNAFTLNDVLEYLDGKTDSVKKVNGFFDTHRHSIAGESLTLDEIERRGRDLHDPRIHFAINCASASCPKLQPFVYTAAELDAQLNLATSGFFADPGRGLRLRRDDSTVFLSPILKWYAGDFTGATSGTGQFLSRARAAISGDNVMEFVIHHVTQEVASYLRQKRPTVKYLDYDWTLNSQKLHPKGR